ncbi:hypothetical protein [Caldimonas manganoxidans]|uniref:hypothetical protein n=1 Tax=Caldimonas manganoxidans TaxID=196015 RepID=UPI00039B33F5|nr:hypothetical protein [Caldimonas manganoxidans]
MLHDRRGYSRLPAPQVPARSPQPFKADEPAWRDVFVAIDRATRWVFIAIKSHKTAAAKAFLHTLHEAARFEIHTLLTDNGRELTDRPFGSKAKGAACVGRPV